jgi:(R,R)-butanediol dehydrogenase / meso-butanediol dehydrogenase / diacetyl reductase
MSNFMKAALWYGPKDIRVEKVEEPSPREGEIKIRVKWCGICGTDVGEYLHGPTQIRNPPVILGHEYVGEVVEVAKGVQGFALGDRATALNVRSCGKCELCKVKSSMSIGKKMELCEDMDMTGLTTPGAFAEYICIPAYLAVKIDGNLTWEEGTMINPLSVGIHALKRGNLRVGETAVVIGDGTIGQLTLQGCLASGVRAAFLVGEEPFRMKIAKDCGAKEVFHYKDTDLRENLKELLGGRLPEVTFDCVGTEKSLQTAIHLVAKGGRVLLVGIYHSLTQIDSKDVVLQEKNLSGVLSQDYEDYFIADALISQKKIASAPLITKRIAVEDLVDGGIKELISNKSRHLRILVHP